MYTSTDITDGEGRLGCDEASGRRADASQAATTFKSEEVRILKSSHQNVRVFATYCKRQQCVVIEVW